jgi:hypothetical protein
VPPSRLPTRRSWSQRDKFHLLKPTGRSGIESSLVYSGLLLIQRSDVRRSDEGAPATVESRPWLQPIPVTGAAAAPSCRLRGIQ